MKRLRDRFGLIDRLRYFWWRFSGSPEPFIGRISGKTVLTIRPAPASDLETAHEIFIGGAYRPPKPLVPPPQRIVDAGANVGLSLLFWSEEFPGCSIIAFEPVAVHVRQIHLQLERNPHATVTLHAAAACSHNGMIRLSDSENKTHVVSDAAGEGPRAVAVDFFEAVGTDPIDILKIDIEGGEYELLADPRFASLNVRALVMEWHNTPSHPMGRSDCFERLRNMSYTVIETVPGDQYGLLWAFKMASE